MRASYKLLGAHFMESLWQSRLFQSDLGTVLFKSDDIYKEVD